jgi:uncharacterized repeat protein (TIGR03803 family)
MTNPVQRRSWISRICLRTPNVALALAVVLVPTVLVTRSARAQSGELLLHAFTGADGAYPFSALVRDKGGNLYGTTSTGAPSPFGTVFKLDTTGKETVLHSFAGYPTDGDAPFAGVIQDKAGNLYGTTWSGGADNNGTVFKLDGTGKETVLYSFCSQPDCPDGLGPYYGGVIRDEAGSLYGTTYAGGASGYGTAFKLDATGKETVLYSFCSRSGCADGADPAADLIRDQAGNLYGTTPYGGVGTSCGGAPCGTVFKLDTTGTETVLHSFANTDGKNPSSGLLMDSAGILYGITGAGGAYGYGVVFQLDTTGKETVLYSFTGGADGDTPEAGLVQDSAGNLYGCTFWGGTYGYGTVFKLDTTGKETVLYSFGAYPTDGAHPVGRLLLDAAGNLYGTTSGGGNFSCIYGCGTVFEVTPSGIKFSPSKVPFATQLVHTKSAIKTVRLTNTSSMTLNITSILATGDFLQANDCPESLQPQTYCSIDVVFKPKAKGIRLGDVDVFDDFEGSPQQVPLTGVGTVVKLSPANVDFGKQKVGTKSQPAPVKLTNAGSAALSISQIKISGANFGDFTESDNCGHSVPAGGSCTISVTFAPTAKGKRSAGLSISDNGGGSPQVVPLTGTGT